MRAAVFGAAFRVAGFGAAVFGCAVCLELPVLLSACHVALVQEARAPQFQALLALLALQTLPTLPTLPTLRSLPLVLLAIARLALLALQGLGVRRFQDLSFLDEHIISMNRR